MEYNFREIEKKWQTYWKKHRTFKTDIDYSRPKYYVLDMFPYPSGAGLHVGHPLGYIASDIYARYMRLKGYNVLHPMGFDAYGLPAEQYAIQTGTHPAVTTEKNIRKYRKQLNKLGFSFDWDREVVTSDPAYYKWTQWTFIQLFKSWYNLKTDKAEPIEKLIKIFEKEGNMQVQASSSHVKSFSSEEWKYFPEKEKQDILMNYRLAYLSETWVNWCPELGTVLANDEVKDGYSERGGYPVERKRMKQWSLRITAYAQRLLDGLDTIDWSNSIKEVQRNWIGRSEGAVVYFDIQDRPEKIEVFTTRPDTLFGATFMVLAPEHPFIDLITKKEYKKKVQDYVKKAVNRSERDRIADVQRITGIFTGAYAINPVNRKKIPVWIAEYVLAGYGTGAIMAVPGHDSRDFTFARHFGLPVIQVVTKVKGQHENPDIWEDAYDSKEGYMINSGFLDGMSICEAIPAIIVFLEKEKRGYGKVNYRLRDAIFSRQRYWGEPFPVYYKEGIPYPLDDKLLPLKLPEVDKYLPTERGDPPLARAKNWVSPEGYQLETYTMPGFAGSSGYYLRYMDPHNDKEYFSREANSYWKNVDLYIGGDEHATGHLIYSRFWNKFLYDLGLAVAEEPFQKLINQGKIQGRSSLVYRIVGENTFVSYNLREQYKITRLHVDINLVQNDILDIEAFRKWRPEFNDAEFILEDGKYICGWEIEKMSKSKHNVQTPDDLVEKYGADTLRMYEMFLGPIEQSKPWDTNGIEGAFRFIKKFWRLFHDENNSFYVSENKPDPQELKILHKTIKKVHDDIERFSFHTGVSAFMICTNELSDLHCNKREILEKLVILISPYAPHLAEELWEKLGYNTSVTFANFPEYDETYLADEQFEYPVSFNGKMRFKLTLPIDMTPEDIEKAVREEPRSKKWQQGKTIRKVIIIPRRIINVVTG